MASFILTSFAFFALLLCSSSSPERQIHTWVQISDNAIDLLTPFVPYIGSLSIYGGDDVGTRRFSRWARSHNISTYLLVGGDKNSFLTAADRNGTIAHFLQMMQTVEVDGLDLDFEMEPTRYRHQYDTFLRQLRAAMPVDGKLSHCVDDYEEGEMFFTPRVLTETMDMVRYMSYDMYWAPGVQTNSSSVGPVTSLPITTAAMAKWRRFIPPNSPTLLVLGLPAYDNVYDVSERPIFGAQTTGGIPADASDVQILFDVFHQVRQAWYTRPNGHKYIHWLSDEWSMKRQLEVNAGGEAGSESADAIGLWSFTFAAAGMLDVLMQWVTGARSFVPISGPTSASSAPVIPAKTASGASGAAASTFQRPRHGRRAQ